MARKKAKAKKALPYVQRKQRRELKKQTASANGATIGAHCNGSKTGGDQRHQDARRTTCSTNQLKADKIHLNHKAPSSRKAKNGLGNRDSLNIRGGHHQPFGSFDFVTVNAHGAGDERNNNVRFHDDPDISHRRDQGDIRADRQTRQAEGADEHAGPQANLLNAYTHHSELQLDDLGVVTLSLAGQTAKQICLEATFEFLQKVSRF